METTPPSKKREQTSAHWAQNSTSWDTMRIATSWEASLFNSAANFCLKQLSSPLVGLSSKRILGSEQQHLGQGRAAALRR